MKTFALLLGILFSLNVSAAPAQKQNTEYLKFWVTSDKKTTHGKFEDNTIQVRQRVMIVSTVPVQVATMTSGKIVAKDKAVLPTDFIGGLSTLLGIKKWRHEDRGSYTAYEAPEPKTNRYIKVFVSKKGNTFEYSIVSIRLPYLFPAYFESELLQRKEIDGGKSVADLYTSKSTFANYFRAVILGQDAHAMASASDFLESWITKFWGPATTSVGGLTSSVVGGTGALNNASDSIRDGSNAIKGLTAEGDKIANNLADWKSTVDNGISSVNRDVDKITDPKTLLKAGTAAGLGLGFGTAIGGALGNLLVHFVADGIAPLAKQLFYSVMGQMTEQQENQVKARSAAAWQNLADASKKVAEIERAMAIQMLELQASGARNPLTQTDANNMVESIDSYIRTTEKAQDASWNAEDKMVCSAYLTDLKRMKNGILEVSAYMGKNGPVRGPADICRGFDNLYQQWVSAELELNNARNSLKKDMYYLIVKADDDADYSNTDITNQDTKINTCKKNKGLVEANNDASKAGCTCEENPRPPACKSVCYRVEMQKIVVNNCVGMAQTVPLTESEKNTSARLQAENSNMLSKTYASLNKSNCKIGQKASKYCTGKEDGMFTQMKSTMDTQFKDVQEKCGNKIMANIPEPDDDDAPAATVTGAVANLQDTAKKVTKSVEDVNATINAATLPKTLAMQKAARVDANNLPLASQPEENIPTPTESPAFQPKTILGSLKDSLINGVNKVKSWL
jgi:hypothetical protein